MGAFNGLAGRPEQVLISASKVPVLILATFVLSLPSFYLLNAVAGVAGDFRHALRAHVQAQAAVCLLLMSFAPITAFWYASDRRYEIAIMLNAVMFSVASLSGQIVLLRLYGPLISRNPRHKILLRVWLVVYAFVGVQMGWVLRPFIGSPGSRVQFFREGAWGNACIKLWNIVTR